eukprot:TRINITY_DN16139_c0_g1_i1.p1 TRINITY_DN16139_c0_g1~~TRINITY_DN16139_c0_g1_i1.p1  ORF type:complete len:835 (+),score=106.06 TRINITY_DN16139_c0_g1_i1:162-2507(+)
MATTRAVVGPTHAQARCDVAATEGSHRGFSKDQANLRYRSGNAGKLDLSTGEVEGLAAAFAASEPMIRRLARHATALLHLLIKCARGMREDVMTLWRNEIIGYTQRSIAACEVGAEPWILAFVVLGLTAIAVGGLAAAVAARPAVAVLRGSYWLTRMVSLRWLAFVHCFAFLSALWQNKALIGDKGILPARCLLERAAVGAERAVQVDEERGVGNRWRSARLLLAKVERLPTLVWFARDYQRLDPWLDRLAGAGLALSMLVLVLGGASAWHLLAIWVLYHSINAIGQRWYSFGWESQLLETTLLAVLAAPSAMMGCYSPGAAFPVVAPPPIIAPWAFRWLAFRIMLGAGLIKARGAKCWLDLTAMCYHLETQPCPNPLTRMLHNLPRRFQLFSTACNHVIELFAPWLLLLPWQPAQAAFGALHIIFQVSLIFTGNLSFLNWLTIVPAIWCFDDAVLAGLFPESVAEALAKTVVEASTPGEASTLGGCRTVVSIVRDLAAAGIIAWLSIPVYTNLFGDGSGGRQKMNSTFERQVEFPLWLSIRLFGGGVEKEPREPTAKKMRSSAAFCYDSRSLRLLNTYGAFGSVNTERVEIVFEGRRLGCRTEKLQRERVSAELQATSGKSTASPHLCLDAASAVAVDASAATEWREYTFKVAVDDPLQRPGIISPYHLRLDWCRWIASCAGRRARGHGEPWVLSFVVQLLLGTSEVRSLLAPGGDPFEGGLPPTQVRAGLFLYRFAPPPVQATDPYWHRERIGEYLPPLVLDDVLPHVEQLFGPLQLMR